MVPQGPNNSSSLTQLIEAKHERAVENLIEAASDEKKAGYVTEIERNLLLHKTVKLEARLAMGKLLSIMLPKSLFVKDNNALTALHVAVLDKGCIKCCKRFIAYFIRDDATEPYSLQNFVNETNDNGESALHFAIKYNHLKIVTLLLKNGAKSNLQTTDSLGYTPLHYAADGCYTNCIEKLLGNEEDDSKGQTLLNMASREGKTALIIAAGRNCADACQKLSKTDITIIDKRDMTAISYAVINGYYVVLKTIFDNSDVSVLAIELVRKLLYLASFTANEKILIYLLDKYPIGNISGKEKLIKQMLENASNRNRFYNLKIILEHGNNIFRNHIDTKLKKGDTMLHIALRKSNYRIALLLLENNANINIKNEKGEFALHLLASSDPGKVTVFEEEYDNVCKRVMKDSRGYADYPNAKKETPLYLATNNNNHLILRQLLRKAPKIYVEEEIDYKFSPIHVAAKKGFNECLTMLLNNLCSYQMERLKLITPHPLHLAAENGHLASCKLLISKLKVSNSNVRMALPVDREKLKK